MIQSQVGEFVTEQGCPCGVIRGEQSDHAERHRNRWLGFVEKGKGIDRPGANHDPFRRRRHAGGFIHALCDRQHALQQFGVDHAMNSR